MSSTEQSLEEELAAVVIRLQQARQKRVEADQEEAAARAELREIAARQAGGPSNGVQSGGRPSGTLAASSLPPLPKGARGQGDRIVELLRERPRASFDWLATCVYGEAMPEN